MKTYEIEIKKEKEISLIKDCKITSLKFEIDKDNNFELSGTYEIKGEKYSYDTFSTNDYRESINEEETVFILKQIRDRTLEIMEDIGWGSYNEEVKKEDK